MWGSLSLTSGHVCRLPESQSAVISLLSVCTTHIPHVTKCMSIQHIQGPCQSSFSAYTCSSCPPHNFLARTTVENPVSKSTSIFACVSVAAGTCLPSRSLAAAVYSCLLLLSSECYFVLCFVVAA
jgi:hypothetical protein